MPQQSDRFSSEVHHIKSRMLLELDSVLSDLNELMGKALNDADRGELEAAHELVEMAHDRIDNVYPYEP